MYRRAADEGHVIVLFADLAGFTAFAEAKGDLAATHAASRFALRAMQLGRRHGLRPVKTLGDGVLFVGKDPVDALAAASEITERFDGSDDLPSAHVGVHKGEVVEQDGDIFGRVVNLAARVAAAARPGQILITDALAPHAARLAGAQVKSVGFKYLRGLGRPLELFELCMRKGTAA